LILGIAAILVIALSVLWYYVTGDSVTVSKSTVPTADGSTGLVRVVDAYPLQTKEALVLDVEDSRTGFRFKATYEQIESIRRAAEIALFYVLEDLKPSPDEVTVYSREDIIDPKTGEWRMETDKEYGLRCKRLREKFDKQLEEYEGLLKVLSKPLIENSSKSGGTD
jgi:hypothetical protein